MYLCSWYCSKGFVSISSFHLQNNPVGEGLFLSVLLQMKKLGCGEAAFSSFIQLGLECRPLDCAVVRKCCATSNNNKKKNSDNNNNVNNHWLIAYQVPSVL